MTNLDEFESVFRAADKEQFEVETVSIRSIAVVSDLEGEDEQHFLTDLQAFSKHLNVAAERWTAVSTRGSVKEIVNQLKSVGPDLICTYRNLQIPATDFPYSLGVFVDVMTQATNFPILLMPHPQAGSTWPSQSRNVLSLTDDLAGDHHLVNYSAKMACPDGKLVLAHLEDEATLNRYMATIACIPSIDTNEAKATIEHQLLKTAEDYIESCQTHLADQRPDLEVVPSVSVGHRLADCSRLIAEHAVDLLVMNTKDDEQLAMHGLAYPLAVELRETPLLLL